MLLADAVDKRNEVANCPTGSRDHLAEYVAIGTGEDVGK